MQKKPIKRHPRLAPLSREHHKGLILAQLLKRDVPDYKNMPTEPGDKLAYAEQQFRDILEGHFRREEEELLPRVQLFDQTLTVMAGKILEEHQLLRRMLIDARPLEGEPLAQQLDELGRTLERHIRYEERQFFARIQELVPDSVLESLHL